MVKHLKQSLVSVSKERLKKRLTIYIPILESGYVYKNNWDNLLKKGESAKI